MKLKDKVRNAVLRGINETFDIDDMTHDIENTPIKK